MAQIIKRDGVTVSDILSDDFAVLAWFHKNVSYSMDHATTHEGYSVENVGTFYAIASDYDYNETHKRERLSIWSGPFASQYEGEALSLPKGDGYMITKYNGEKVRVTCETPRTDKNFVFVDGAINAALNAQV